MDVGIALPNAVEGAAPDQMLEWARRAEGRRHYYAWLGEEVAGSIVASAAKDAEAVRRYLAEYEQAGRDELVLCPSSSDPAQVDLLADAAGL
jgi:hypothetical protein